MQALGGQPLSPTEPFLGDLTLGQYMDLPDEDRARLWDEWAEEERGSKGAEEQGCGGAREQGGGAEFTSAPPHLRTSAQQGGRG